MSREEVCRKLFDLEKLIEKYSRDIPGSEWGLCISEEPKS
jgi:hypothetical protein